MDAADRHVVALIDSGDEAWQRGPLELPVSRPE
jgi:hypothetical protein